MSNMQFYKPHIRATIYADVSSSESAELYKPIVINQYPDTLELSCTIVRDLLTGNFALTLLLDVVNLSTYIKWQLLSSRYRYIVVTAGYLGPSYYDIEDEEIKEKYIKSKSKIIFKGSLLWMGTIVDARKKVTTRFLGVQNPAQTLSANTEQLSIRYDAGYNLYQLINDIAKINNNLNVKLNLSDEEYQDVLAGGKVVDNAFNRKDINAVLSLYGITIAEGYDLTDDESITLSTYTEMNSRSSKPTEDNTFLVTEDTGLIDIPTMQSSGKYPAIRFKMLFDPRISTFDYVKIRNSDIQLPSVDETGDVDNFNTGIYLDHTSSKNEDYKNSIGYGFYLVLKITYSLDSRGGNFTQDIEASPYSLYDQILGNREES